MENDQKQLVQWLFTTKALRVAPADQPFWYTSGTLGPYYINTHFLYGSEEEAVDLLAVIDRLASQPLELPGVLAGQVMRQYRRNTRYRQLMDVVVCRLEDQPCDVVSGGERRDFFFSVCAALLLQKPHVSLLKNGQAVYSTGNLSKSRLLAENSLTGQIALHVADLVTEASSYTRSWLPGIARLGASMPLTLAIVDRNQNGRAILSASGTRLVSLMTIDETLFDQARDAGLIDQAQQEQVLRFVEDPQQYMNRFLEQHPGFLEEQIVLGGKNRERAQRFLEQSHGKPQ